jgi:imidazole glycerol-phosphate synthase subunit HisH
MTTGLIDYGGGNLQSVRNAARHLGYECPIIATADDLHHVDALIFPGQGAFGDCMAALAERGLIGPLRSWLLEDRPFFGICIGYQVLFTSGQENPGVSGLSIFGGEVIRFPDQPGIKVPHMGWNTAVVTQQNPAWDGLGDAPHFYFVHSYYPQPDDASLVASWTTYGNLRFASAIQRGQIIATQFHPEKSQATGLKLLENFLKR